MAARSRAFRYGSNSYQVTPEFDGRARVSVSRMVPDVHVYGGLVLNDTVGGLNTAAVRLAVSMGAKEIWMPTRSAENHRRHHAE